MAFFYEPLPYLGQLTKILPLALGRNGRYVTKSLKKIKRRGGDLNPRWHVKYHSGLANRRTKPGYATSP